MLVFYGSAKSSLSIKLLLAIANAQNVLYFYPALTYDRTLRFVYLTLFLLSPVIRFPLINFSQIHSK